MNIMIFSSLLLASSAAYFDPSYLVCIPGFGMTFGYLYYHLKRLDLNNRIECGNFFRKNNIVGLFLFLSLVMKGLYSNIEKNKDEK